MTDKKEEKKDAYMDAGDNQRDKDLILEGRGLHDLYRHTTKLIK